MTCPNCNTQNIPDEANFCPNCGFPFFEGKETNVTNSKEVVSKMPVDGTKDSNVHTFDIKGEKVPMVHITEANLSDNNSIETQGDHPVRCTPEIDAMITQQPSQKDIDTRNAHAPHSTQRYASHFWFVMLLAPLFLSIGYLYLFKIGIICYCILLPIELVGIWLSCKFDETWLGVYNTDECSPITVFLYTVYCIIATIITLKLFS